MKKSTLALFLASLTLSATIMTGCSASLVNFKYENSQFVNKRLGLRYNSAPTCYEPVSIGEAYGYYGDIDMTFYQIIGLNPKDFLTEEYAGTATSIFYNENITLPELSEMKPDTVYVCISDIYTFATNTITDSEIIDKLVDLYENGEQAEWPLISANRTYNLKFHSDTEYPELYYALTYSEFDEGNYIYERYSRRCVDVGNLIYDITNPTNTSETEVSE